ncbi:Ephrin type-A receptor 4 [Fasciola hepatica]|uniref:Ephrin type-A receptor 4 n=1 Tax=Fasciola hepatica TaxID=6192 RepID=A0A4E0S0N7_FASHE|nr:Ephrin type-A receptor 4 [Fasciola hepatica]
MDERRSENVPDDNNGTENASKEEPINVERRPSHTSWEFDPSQLKIDKTIDEVRRTRLLWWAKDRCFKISRTVKHRRPTGEIREFGEVCSGVLAGSRLVAIKMLRLDVPDKAKQDFLKEVHTTQRLQHPNIVVLLGVVTKCEPQMIVLEFMEKGSLDKYLQVSDALFSESVLF